jgi:hypothetical protein
VPKTKGKEKKSQKSKNTMYTHAPFLPEPETPRVLARNATIKEYTRNTVC